MVTSRERVELALNHQEPDRVPLDLGGCATSGMQVNSVYILRQALGLDAPGTPVKVVEPYQMLGEIKLDLMDALGVDVVPLEARSTFFGYHRKDWKPWTTFQGTPVLVPGGFNTDPQPATGDILQYPDGDYSAPASGRMPKDGFYFDTIVRQPPIDDDNLNVEDNLEEVGPIGDDELAHFERESKRLYEETDKAILANFGGTAFGDIALVPVPWVKYPKGIRDIAEWYASTASRQDYVLELFDRQCTIALENLEKIYDVVGNRVSAVFVTGTDFGMQNGPFISLKSYRKLFKPFHQRVNDWIHQNTTWKTFIHSCGSVWALLDDFVEAGFDVLNPVQTSAAHMDPQALKDKVGDKMTFWGGGIDTQRTLPFGSADDVRREVCERMQIFGPGGGFVFNSVHNIQSRVPAESLLALYEAVREYGQYPIS
ncbi:MAG TPA: uroporphyrinogen decarboxylase family protein [Aggregatilineaceae bacterium]|nr:uroporphyrinogen decarboxylase family protein [Aggregatilineaceae bacterium]